MFGFLLGVGLGWLAKSASSSSSSTVLRPPEASQYTITVNNRIGAEVRRHGVAWAWEAPRQNGGSSGAEATATGALRAATRAAVANHDDTLATLHIMRRDGRLLGTVHPEAADTLWRWSINLDGQSVMSGTSSTRGGAAETLYDNFEPYTER